MIILDAPVRWARARLASIAEVRLGRQRSPSRAFGPHMAPYLRAANVTWQGIDLADVKEMDFTPAEVETYRLKSGDILLAEASGSPSEVGKPALYIEGAQIHCFQNTLIRVRAAPELSRFLHLHFLRDVLLGRFATAARGVGIQHLGAEALSGWEVVLPPVGEQGRIVDATDSYLTRLDDAVASLEQVQTKLKAYRASVLRAAVEGRLVPTEASLARAEKRDYERGEMLLARILKERRRRWEEAELARLQAAGKPPKDDRWKGRYKEPFAPDTRALPELPDGWCWASADAFFWDSDYGTSEKCTPGGTGNPVLRIPNVHGGRISLDETKYAAKEADLKRGGAVEPNDFLFIRTNGSRSLIGRGALVVRRYDPALHFASYLIRLRLVAVEAVPEWFALAWHGPSVRQQLLRVAASSAGQHNLSLSAASSFAVPLPPTGEQSRILAEMDVLIDTATKVEEQTASDVRRCVRLRQGVLRWAFEGKLADQDPSDEAAEDLLARIRAERAAVVPTKKIRGRRAKGAA